jgi:hypothetical protein
MLGEEKTKVELEITRKIEIEVKIKAETDFSPILALASRNC